NVDLAVDMFYTILYGVLDRSVPRAIPRHSRYPPWFTHEIISGLKLKNYYRKRWNQTKNRLYLDEFNRIRSLSKQCITTSHKRYLEKIENTLRSNPLNLWQYIHSKQGTTRIPGKVNYANIDYDYPVDIVNTFGKKFSSNFYPKPDYDIPDVISNNQSFNMQPVTTELLINIMSKFDSKFTCGDDLIPSFLVRDGRYVFATPLSIIINLSINESVFPKAWKRARITPVYKKGD